MSDYVVEAVLRARDDGFSKSFKDAGEAMGNIGKQAGDAQQKTSGMLNTMIGMGGAMLATKALATAWGLVKNSIGSALGRIDTMENFERAITRMTGSANASKIALADLNKIVGGTAYGLDVAAKATQDFVLRGVKLEDATKAVGVWADAVAFYGKGTNEQLESVTEAISKMRSKGKIDMQHMQAFFNAGIDPVSVYAEATGKGMDEVQKALSKGEISADGFFTVVEKAMAEGTASFKSVSGAAKDAGSNWANTFANMKAATTRGVLSIIKSIENARKSANLPGMKDTVAKFGKGMERTLKKIGNVLGFIATNFEAFGTAVATMFIAFAAYKTIQKAQKAIEGFSKALAANGIGLAIAAIALLVGAFKGLVDWTDRQDTAHGRAMQAAKMHKEAISDLAGEVGKIKNTFADTITTIDGNATQAKLLVTQYKDLADNTNRTAEETGRMKVVAQQLISIFPDMASKYNAVTGAFEGGTKAMEDNIKQMLKVAKVDAHIEALKGLYVQQEAARKGYNDTAAAMRQLDETGQRFYKDGLPKRAAVKLSQALKGYADELYRINPLIATSENAIYGLSGSQEKAAEVIEEVVAQLTEEQVEFANFARKFGASSEELQKFLDDNNYAFEGWSANIDQHLKVAGSAIDGYASIATNGFTRLEQSTTISLGKFLDNMKQNTQDVAAWGQNMKTLIGAGVHDGVIKQLEAMGPAGKTQGARFIKELERLNKGALGKFDELTPAAQAKIKELGDAMGDGFLAATETGEIIWYQKDWCKMGGDVPTIMAGCLEANIEKLYLAGVLSVEGLLDGINWKMDAVRHTGINLGNVLVRATRDGLEEKSPSRLMMKIGEYAGDGLIIGIQNRLAGISAMSDQIMQAVVPDMGTVNNKLAAIDSNVSASYDVSIDRAVQPLDVVLNLGNRAYNAFVSDISASQGRSAELKEIYSV